MVHVEAPGGALNCCSRYLGVPRAALGSFVNGKQLARLRTLSYKPTVPTAVGRRVDVRPREDA